MVLVSWVVEKWELGWKEMMGRDVPLLPTRNPFLRGYIPIRSYTRCRNLDQFFFFFFINVFFFYTSFLNIGVDSGERGG